MGKDEVHWATWRQPKTTVKNGTDYNLDSGLERKGPLANCIRVSGENETHGSVDKLQKLCKNQQLHQVLEAMDLVYEQGLHIPSEIIYSLLQECTKKKDLAAGSQIYSFIVSSGLDSSANFGDHLIRMFASCECLVEANQVFQRVAKPSIYTWNAIISANAKLGDSMAALVLVFSMQQKCIQPNKFTFLGILKASASVKAIHQGRLIHEQIVRNRLESDVVIGSSLVDMYAKCSSLEEARVVFDILMNRNVVSWNGMLSGYVQHENVLCAFDLFKSMQEEGVKPEKVTFSCILKTCGSKKDLGMGKFIHEQIIKYGVESDVVIGSALVDMYAKCGSIAKGREVFDKLSDRNLVSWNAMIAGYAKQGDSSSALKLFEQMQQEGITPEKVTFLCILKACSISGGSEQGRIIHEQIIRSGVESDIIVDSTIVDMYAKFGMLEEARKIFDNFLERDTVLWNTMIGGYAQHGQGLAALELFEKMEEEGLKPEKVTFTFTLKACSSVAAINQGRFIHSQAIRRGFEWDEVVGSALVDMYAKCGSVEEAHRLFDRLSIQDIVTWNALIAGYALYGNYIVVGHCLTDMKRQGLRPNARTYTSILLACSYAGQVDECRRHFKSMHEDHGIIPGIEHFTCVIGLFGRAGCLNEAEEILQTMPALPDITGWRSLLLGCQTYGNLNLGRHCYDQAVQLDHENAIGYVLMSNIYADAYMWEAVHEMQGLRKGASAWKKPGKAWIEVNDEVHDFIVGNTISPPNSMLYAKFRTIRNVLKRAGYLPQLDLVLEPDVPKEGALYGRVEIDDCCG